MSPKGSLLASGDEEAKKYATKNLESIVTDGFAARVDLLYETVSNHVLLTRAQIASFIST